MKPNAGISSARKNIRKAQQAWKSMTHRQHAISQPEGRSRARPGTTGEGEYFRIVVRPKEEFVTFRYHDVGRKGHIQRLSGRRTSGSWATQAWLINKNDARRTGGRLEPVTSDAKKIIETLGSTPHYVKGDIFTAKDRPNVPEKDKPTPAQTRARSRNIRKAQAARRSV